MTRLGWFEFQEKLIRLPLILSPPLSFGPLVTEEARPSTASEARVAAF